MSNSIERYDTLLKTHEFVFCVFYRGHWCPFCQSYLRDLETLSLKIKAAGGAVFTVTAENESELPKMRSSSGYRGETIVDPENILAKELKRRGVVDVAISEKKGYPHGMAQPAIVVGGKAFKGVAYSWAIVPATMNLGGAKDRPYLNDVWDNVDARLKGQSESQTKPRLTGLSNGLMYKIFGK